MSTASLDEHRRFLNLYYRHVRHVYDMSRKYYLFGRDRALRALLAAPWETLIEVGPGTGRNLRFLERRRPEARFGGIEASDEMLAHARSRCGFAQFAHGFAEEADYAGVLGTAPERILFSYCLSMVGEPARALERARAGLAPGGAIVIVDFGDMAGMGAFAPVMARFLRSFHVTALDPDLLQAHGATLAWGPGRYYVIATIEAPA